MPPLPHADTDQESQECERQRQALRRALCDLLDDTECAFQCDLKDIGPAALRHTIQIRQNADALLASIAETEAP